MRTIWKSRNCRIRNGDGRSNASVCRRRDGQESVTLSRTQDQRWFTLEQRVERSQVWRWSSIKSDRDHSWGPINPVNSRILTVRLSGRPRKLTLIQVYAPTNQAEDQEKENFYTPVYSRCTNKYQSRTSSYWAGTLTQKSERGHRSESTHWLHKMITAKG